MYDFVKNFFNVKTGSILAKKKPKVVGIPINNFEKVHALKTTSNKSSLSKLKKEVLKKPKTLREVSKSKNP